jgi:putative ABC transport system permease protein
VTVLRLALRELRNDPRFAAFFATSLALGFMGFVALDSFQASVGRELRARSQAFLGGDLVVTSRRPLAPEEVARLDAAAGAGAQSASVVELFSMAAAGPRARLVELHAIDAAFPLRGVISLEGGGPAREPEQQALRERRGVWVDPALLAGLRLGLRDELALGTARFRILGAVARDGGRPTSGFSIAPRVYLALEHLPATQLVATGSRIEYRRFYRLAAGEPDAVARAMRQDLADAQLDVRSHSEVTSDLSRAYGKVSDALGLVALAAIFLAGVGAAHLFRAFLQRRVVDVAILLSLGATRRRAERVFLAQLALLGVAAGLLACALAALLLPGLVRLAQGFVPADFSPRIGWNVVLSVSVLAVAGGIAACLPLLLRLRELRPAELFAAGGRGALTLRNGHPGAWLPALALFVGVCLWRAPSPTTGAWFAGIFGASLVLLAGLGLGVLRGLAALPSPRRLAPRLALRELARGRGTALSCFTALALCVLLQGIAPQLRATLSRDLETPGPRGLPGLFLFDIQPEQREPLSLHVAARGVRLDRVSPLVRARLTAIDGRPVQDPAPGAPPPARSRAVRDAEGDARSLRSRTYNLTYRDALAPDERLLAGQPFSGARRDGEPAEISLEIDFAERLGVEIGDSLDFDVQGVPVSGRVVNLREVRWQSFEPNFFVAFQSGVLEDAPQTFLASVPSLPAEEREALQASLAEAFPNVSSVDVTRAVQRLLALVAQLEWALSGTAALSLLVGLAVVYAIARDQARSRRFETNLLKVLGADFRVIRGALDCEYGALGALAALAGSTVCALASAVLARFVLDVPWTPALAPLFGSAFGVPLLCVVAARLAARSVLRERPLVLLQEP